MILIRFDDVVKGLPSVFAAQLINISAYVQALPSSLARFSKWLGTLLLTRLARVEMRMVTENLEKIVGVQPTLAHNYGRKFVQRRSIRLVLEQLIRKSYFKKIPIETVFPDDGAYPTVGCMFALAHTIDAYLLTTLVARYANEANGEAVCILRAPISAAESEEFMILARWAGVENSVKFLDPQSSADIKLAIRTMRSGGKVLSFVDSPAQFGRSPPVTFFGRRAWIALGALDLARLAGVPVYLTYLRRGAETSNGIQLVFRKTDAERKDGVQAVVDLLEEIIRDDPPSWDFLITLRSYFYHPGAQKK